MQLIKQKDFCDFGRQMGGKDKTWVAPRLQSKARPVADCGAYLQERLGRIFRRSYGVANFCGKCGIFDLGTDSGIACFGGSHAKSSPKNSFPFEGFPYGGEFCKISPLRRRRADGGIDRIFALAARFAAQIKHSNSVYFRPKTNTSEWDLGQKEALLP